MYGDLSIKTEGRPPKAKPEGYRSSIGTIRCPWNTFLQGLAGGIGFLPPKVPRILCVSGGGGKAVTKE